MANKISIIDDILITHNTGDTNSIENSRNKTPCNFIEMYFEIMSFLQKNGIYKTYEKSFSNFVVSHTAWQLNTLNEKSRRLAVERLRIGFLEIFNKPQNYYFCSRDLDYCKKI